MKKPAPSVLRVRTSVRAGWVSNLLKKISDTANTIVNNLRG